MNMMYAKHVVLFSSERGMVYVFRGISLGCSPREIPRKTHAIQSSDEKRNILFHITWTNGLELIFQYSLVTEKPRNTALSYMDFPRRPCQINKNAYAIPHSICQIPHFTFHIPHAIPNVLHIPYQTYPYLSSPFIILTPPLSSRDASPPLDGSPLYPGRVHTDYTGKG